MSLNAISSLESAIGKFFMNSTYQKVGIQKVGIKRFWAQEAEMSLTANSSLKSARGKYFHELNVHHVQKVGIKRFLGSGGQNQSNSHQLSRIGEWKIFHELDVHHPQKVGIKRSWAQVAEMSLTTNSSLESARRKFFMNSTYIMSRKQEPNVFGLRKPK